MFFGFISLSFCFKIIMVVHAYIVLLQSLSSLLLIPILISIRKTICCGPLLHLVTWAGGTGSTLETGDKMLKGYSIRCFGFGIDCEKI